MFASYDRVTQLFKWMLCRYFAGPADEFERAEQEDLFRRMLHESELHFISGMARHVHLFLNLTALWISF